MPLYISFVILHTNQTGGGANMTSPPTTRYNVFDDLCRRQSLDLHFMNWGYADIANVSDKDTVDQIDASASKADPRAKDVLVQPIPIVRARPGRLSALRVFHSKSVLYGAFVWARMPLNRQKWRFPARAGRRSGVPACGPPPEGHRLRLPAALPTAPSQRRRARQGAFLSSPGRRVAVLFNCTPHTTTMRFS
jgi:hypothetical protein